MSSFQRKVGQIRSKVGEFKDKLAGKRQNVLEGKNDLQLEAEVLGMRDAFQTLLKRGGQECHIVDDRKLPLFQLGNRMMSTGLEIGDKTPFGAFYSKVGRLELDLGQIELNHHRTLQKEVYTPISDTVAREFPPLLSMRKKLSHLSTECDSAATRLSSAEARQQKTGAAKVEACRDELDDAKKALESLRSQYMEALIDTAAKEKDFIDPLVTLLHEQLNYHRLAIQLLESTLPAIAKQQAQAGQRKVFGQAMKGDDIDPVIALLACVINRDGLEAQGVFRLAGSKVQIRKLRAALNSNRADLESSEAYNHQIHAVADALKIYLREMSDCLLQSEHYDQWMQAAQIEDHNEKLYALQNLINALPRGNYVTLRFLCRFLSNVVAHEEQNKMGIKNIGIVIGPNLLRPTSVGEDDDASNFTMADTNVQGSMCETLVEYHDWLFPKEEGELPGDISDLAALRQKVPNVPAAPESSAGPQAASGSMASPVRPRSSVMPTSARASVMSSARRVSSASADDDDDMYSSDDGDGDGSHNDNDDTDALVAGIMAEPEASTSRPPLAAKPPLPPAASTKPTRRQSTGSRPTSGGAPALPAKPKPKPLSRPTSGGVEEEKTAPAVPKRTRSRAQSSVTRASKPDS